MKADPRAHRREWKTFGILPRNVRHLYEELWRQEVDNGGRNRGRFLMIEVKMPEPRSAFIEVEDNEDLIVSVLRNNSADINSFVRVLIKPDNELYAQFKQIVAVLNVTDVGDEIEGIGFNAGSNTFHIKVTPELHAQILNQ